MANDVLETHFRLSHPDKILYPELHITKYDVAQYYYAIHDWILPYVTKRPLTLVRCPKNFKHCFFQKHFTATKLDGLFSISIKEKKSKRNYIYINTLQGLMMLAQLSVLEIHPWGSRIDNVDKPDVVIFDLDPDPNVAWATVIAVALLIKEELEALDLQSFVKTTGGKGLHIFVPIKRIYSWEDVKIFAETFVSFLVAKHPTELIGTMSKAKRHGKIFIDHLRNRRGANAVAPYSTRAKATASVSMPLYWKEVKPTIRSDHFTILNTPKRLAELKKDPWDGYFSMHQTLPFK